jgi:NhaA family Na+:H+ antiporter
MAVKAFRLSLPEGMNFRDVWVLGCMAGIGFTVALFVSTVAFPPGPTQDAAKMGALFSFGAAFLSVFAAKLLGVGRFTRKSSTDQRPLAEPAQ